MAREKMICPDCGAHMNFHGEKIDHSAGREDPSFDPDFGGAVEESHSCPQCGRSVVRRVDTETADA